MTQRIFSSVALLFLLAGCSSIPPDVVRSQRIPMNRVYPYPTADEQARAISKVAVEAVASADLGDASPDPTLRVLKRYFEGLLTDNGARTVESGADDFTLKADVTGYRYESSFKSPRNWLFKGDEAMAAKPGSCTHVVRADVSLTVHKEGREAPLRAFDLSSSAEAKTESLDPACPYDAGAREALLATAVRESLPCVRIPVVNFFAPRGYLVEHRRPNDGGYDLFRSTLSPSMIPEDAPTVEVYRQQLSTTAEGARIKQEFPIAQGRVALETRDEATWLEIDLSDVTQPILEGDVVRPVVREGAVSSLTPWGSCNAALDES